MLEDKGYLFVYAFTDFVNGLIMGTIGPLIPFLAASSHTSATSYYFVFISRSVGSVLGAIIYKTLQCYGVASSHHRVIAITSVLFVAFLLIFEGWHNLVGTGVLLGLYALFNFIHNVALSCSLLMVPSKENLFFWLSISNGSFGLGSVVAPLVVDLFTLHSFTFQAVVTIPLIFLYFFALRTPQEKQHQRLQVEQLENEDAEDENNFRYLSTYLAVFLGFNFFLLHGIENINGGWLPTYAYMTGTATKRQAALFATAFWLTYTIARYVSGFINVSVSTKLKRFSQFGVISAFLGAAFSYLNFQLIAITLCAVTQGVSISGIYPLSLAISSEYGLHLTEKQISTIMITMMISEGIMVAPTGYLMQHIYLKVFFISLFLFNLILLLNSRYVLSLLENQQVNNHDTMEKEK